MTQRYREPRVSHAVLAGALAAAVLFAASPARAGGLLLYEIGTADVGLASAGYTARAQDASTVFTNPAGMTRLDGTQATLGAQVLYGDLGFTIGQGTSPGLGGANGGNPIGWFPGGGAFFSYSVSPDLKLGFAASGNFGLALKYDADWAGRYYVQEATLIGMSLTPSIAYRVNPQWSVGASLNAMYGKLHNQIAVNNIGGADGQLVLDDATWGFGANVGVLYEPSRSTRFGLVWNSQVTNIDLGIVVPQGVHASFFHQVDDRWALLGSVGWQQWSKFGQVEVGVDSNDPRSLTTNLNFKDTWHVAGGAQYRLSGPWLMNFGVAYDSEFQDSANVSPMLPANAAWRFGIGAQKEESRTFNWGLAAEYVYGGNLDVNRQAVAPVVVGGRGNLVGSYERTAIIFLAANFNWKF
jgi:long-chain fatty acid transport protein